MVDRHNVHVVRGSTSREYIDAVQSDSCEEIPRDIPRGLSMRISRSDPIDVSKEDGWQKLLSAIEALVRSYDKTEPILAQRQTLDAIAALEEESGPMDTPEGSIIDNDSGDLGHSDEGDEYLDTPGK